MNERFFSVLNYTLSLTMLNWCMLYKRNRYFACQLPENYNFSVFCFSFFIWRSMIFHLIFTRPRCATLPLNHNIFIFIIQIFFSLQHIFSVLWMLYYIFKKFIGLSLYVNSYISLTLLFFLFSCFFLSETSFFLALFCTKKILFIIPQ